MNSLREPPLSLSWPMLSMTSLVNPFTWSLAMREPLESESESTMAPREITLSAVYWDTLPEPEMATSVLGEVSECSGQELAII